VLPATAASSVTTKVRSYSGTVEEGGSVNFLAEIRVIKKRHQPRRVEFVSVSNPPNAYALTGLPLLPCTQGGPISIAGIFLYGPVKNNKFSGSTGPPLPTGSRFRGIAYGTRFRGEFTNKGGKANGTARAWVLNSSGVTCDTETLHWTASAD
jgi:hypothetical protein